MIRMMLADRDRDRDRETGEIAAKWLAESREAGLGGPNTPSWPNTPIELSGPRT